MEAAQGGDLAELLDNEKATKALRSDVKRVARLLGGVLSGLEHLHRHHFVHRDLAARNVLLSSADDTSQMALLADLGWLLLFCLLWL